MIARRTAIKNDLFAGERRVEKVEARFDGPALMVEGGQFLCRRFYGIQPVGDQSVAGLGIGNSL